MMDEIKSVLVTGGCGYVGTKLVPQLLKADYRVYVLDWMIYGNYLPFDRRLSCYNIDMRKHDAVRDIIQRINPDAVIDLASISNDPMGDLEPSLTKAVNIEAQKKLIDTSIKNKVKRFIFGSSSEVYGDSKVPMKEGAPFSPKSTYAVAKLVGEEYCQAYYHKYNMPYTVLRYFNVYGPRQDERFVISRFMRQALASETIYVYGDGKQTRDFTHVDDAVNMTLLAATTEETSCQEMNIGTGVSTSINDLATIIIKASNSKNARKQYVDYDKKRPRKIEIFNRNCDINKARKLLHYEPKINLEAGIKRLYGSISA